MALNTPASFMNDPNGIAIEHENAFYYLAHWRHPRDGKFSPLWNIAISARTDAANLLDRLDLIRLDARLSDTAQATDSKAAALSSLQDLGKRQRALNTEIDRHQAERLNLAQVVPADAAQAVIDVALADFFRATNDREREALLAALVGGSEPRMVDAVLRLPGLLFGLTPQVRASIESNAIARNAPDTVRELRELSEAAATTQTVIRKAVELVTQNAALTLQERMVSLGDGAWQPHVKDGGHEPLAALAKRYGVAA